MIYLFLADGFETIEALAPADMLRRAGIELKTVGVTGKTVMSSHKIPVTADITTNELDITDADAIILPGGMPGTLNLEACGEVQKAIDFCRDNSKLICAICAAPSILGHKGLLRGKSAICFPGFENDLTGAEVSDEYVVRDGNIITAKGAGVAVDFALKIVEAVKGSSVSNKVRETIQCR